MKQPWYHNIQKGIWWAGGGLLFSWLATSLSWPMGSDQGVFAWAGDVIVSGGFPYKDAWDTKGPLTHYLYAFVQILFGRTEWGIRLFDLTLLLASSLSLWHLLIKLGHTKAAPIASLLFCFWYGGSGYCHTAQPDGWAGMISIFMVDLLIADRGAFLLKTAILCGLILALLILFKNPFLLLFLVVLGYAWAYKSKNKIQELIFLLSVAGSLIFFLFLVGLWFEEHKALGELINVQFIFNRSVQQNHHKQFGLVWMVTRVVQYFFTIERAFGLIFALIGMFHLWNRERKSAILLSGWFAASLAVVMVQNIFFVYHWHLILPSFSILAAIGIIVSWKTATDPGVSVNRFVFRKDYVKILVSLTAVLLFLTSASHAGLHSYRFFRSVFGLQSWASYYEGFGQKEGADYWYPAIREVSRYVKEKTSDQDLVLVWGYQPLIYYLSGRKPPDRFGGLFPLVSPYADDWIKESYRHEFVQAVKNRLPRYIVFFESDTNILNGKMFKGYLEKFPDLLNLINSRYSTDRLIGNVSVSRLRAGKD